ncbi:hypothetical protein AQUCO_00400731v1 [Aquilegia coerulea]|uniref:Uncharacterized protein n=1 Tax=Aquilegia coerulea TaxID=218851 RepID=A0A2G5EWF1_AQUCA|nr:hypothetical protein AQUCO_00400731v1 [Aquilegia coerulea]
MSRLAPLSEEPSSEDNSNNRSKKGQSSWRNWLKSHFHPFYNKKSDLKILLSVLGCPLFPLSLHTKESPIQVESSAQYIIQHYTAATACRKLEGRVKSIYAIGKVKLVMVEELASSSSTSTTTTTKPHEGCFVLWQMIPDKWLFELVVTEHKVIAGSDGNVAWRHTPWLGAHIAKGGTRPLRRSLQGLDPVTVAAVFSTADFMGEKRMWDEDCFALKLSLDNTALADRSDSTADIIKHVVIGYFSQRSGLLIHLEDSHLTRIQSPGTHPIYWETIMGSRIEDYRAVDGTMIAHSGQSTVTLTRFGNNVKAGPQITRMEETWTIDDIVFNVPGLSVDCFIPPEEVRKEYSDEDLDWKSALHR